MRTFITALTFIWSGMLIGLSFIETPLKFQAPNITLELGLGIGKLVFTTLNRIEIGFSILLIIGLFLVKANNRILIAYAIPLIILLAQTVWLLPVLTARVDAIVAGNTVPASMHHIIFIILEAGKLIALIVAGSLFVKWVT